MAFAIRFSREALAYLERLPVDRQDRVVARLDQIAEDPMSPQFSKALQGGQGFRSARVGDLRIVFRVDSSRLLVQVRRIGTRGQVYRRL